MKEKRENSGKKTLGIIVGIIVILVGIFYFADNKKPKEEKIDPKYLADPQYCETDDDCHQGATCKAVNIYNYGIRNSVCEVVVEGSNCINNKCSIKYPEVGEQ